MLIFDLVERLSFVELTKSGALVACFEMKMLIRCTNTCHMLDGYLGFRSVSIITNAVGNMS